MLTERAGYRSYIWKRNIFDFLGLASIWAEFKDFHLVGGALQIVCDNLAMDALSILKNVALMLRDDINPVSLDWVLDINGNDLALSSLVICLKVEDRTDVVNVGEAADPLIDDRGELDLAS